MTVRLSAKFTWSRADFVSLAELHEEKDCVLWHKKVMRGP